jgi:1,2-diacylglycerol 3-beta-glucosyltransferase
MPANSWPENNSYRNFPPLRAILYNRSDLEASEIDPAIAYSYSGYEGRRVKAAILLIVAWVGTITLHLISWGFWLVLGFTGLLCFQALRILLARPDRTPDPLDEANQAHTIPSVSLLVAAKNEEAVIARGVKMLCNQDYPTDKYEVWVIDDCSTDRTPEVLQALSQEYDNLKIMRRPANAKGGKSGALNEVLLQTKGDFLGVFDADAQVPPDMLRRVLPIFNQEKVGAVQMQKVIANAPLNFWTRGQEAEMALDLYFQQQRKAVHGIGELRGNGQFVRRSALDSCGGWNELTITDDLDLTLRLHLDGWNIGAIAFPAVLEEGVTSLTALWHQRNRWGEGGYQRYLDYWRLIFSDRMGLLKTWDMFGFWIMQYFLPNAAVPDLLMAIYLKQLPVMSPLTTLAISLSLVGMFTGLRRSNPEQKLTISTFFSTGFKTLRGTLYMLHWFVIVASVAMRISVRPKRLKWVKTVHQGTGELQV